MKFVHTYKEYFNDYLNDYTSPVNIYIKDPVIISILRYTLHIDLLVITCVKKLR